MQSIQSIRCKLVFRLYIPPAPKTPVESNAYVEAVNGRFTDAATSAVVEHAPLLTYLAPFSFEARPDGSLATFDVSPIKGRVSGQRGSADDGGHQS